MLWLAPSVIEDTVHITATRRFAGQLAVQLPATPGALPFTWIVTADEILAKVALTQTNVRKLIDNNAR